LDVKKPGGAKREESAAGGHRAKQERQRRYDALGNWPLSAGHWHRGAASAVDDTESSSNGTRSTTGRKNRRRRPVRVATRRHAQFEARCGIIVMRDVRVQLLHSATGAINCLAHSNDECRALLE